MAAKREIPCGIAYATAYNNQPAAPEEILVCESFQMSGVPVTYEQINNQTPDNLQINDAGKNCSFDVSGCEPNVRQLGRIMALAFGGDSLSEGAHLITPTNGASKFLAIYRDLKQAIGTATNTTEVGLGGKIGAMSMAISRNTFVKLGFSGAFCAYGAPRAGLTAVAPEFPLSWHSLRAGDCKIGLNGATPTSERTFNSFNMSYTREQNTDDNVVLDSDQPNDITEGGRTFEFEIGRKFDSAQALAEYGAWENGHEAAIEIELVADPDGTTQTFTMTIPHARIIDSYVQPTGTGNDPVMAMLKCKAFVSGSDPIITVTADDGSAVIWVPKV